MIPRHAPPFSLVSLLSVLRHGHDVSPSALEKSCAEQFDVRETILLPSARTGILLALRVVAPTVEMVIGPAFTCAVVHQTMQLSGLQVRFIDSDPYGYLMDAEDLRKAADGPSAIVLSETYGLRYRTSGAAAGDKSPRIVRIWDMAMCVPRPADFRRLEAEDVAVLSFGLGKCLYAGWGGLLLTRSSELAARVRDLRDRWMTPDTRANHLRHGLEVLARTAAHNRSLYGFGRTLADWRSRRAQTFTIPASSAASTLVPSEADLPREWVEPMTPLNRRLAMANLTRAAEGLDLRHRQAAEYFRHLKPLDLISGIDMESLPDSHFPIRVASKARNALRRYLLCRGIDTGTYFPFPRGLQRANYPNAARASDEVILLPLGRSIREGEATKIARHVTEGLSRVAS